MDLILTKQVNVFCSLESGLLGLCGFSCLSDLSGSLAEDSDASLNSLFLFWTRVLSGSRVSFFFACAGFT